MGIKLLILFTMIFLHIVDDYYLQGWLASAKQKSWWVKNAPDKLYKRDYLVALFMHSFSWSFMIMLPTTIYLLIVGGTWYLMLYLTNLVIHMFVDDLKANQKKDKSNSRPINSYSSNCYNLDIGFDIDCDFDSNIKNIQQVKKVKE